jgi:hypothetical protein
MSAGRRSIGGVSITTRRTGAVVTVVAAAVIVALTGSVAPAAASPSTALAAPVAARPGDAALATALQRAVAGAGFADVVDFGPDEGHCPGNPGCASPAPRLPHVPNVDTAVIELDDAGRVTAASEVLLSRDYPQPVAVSVDADLRASDVHWYRWDAARAEGSTAWDAVRVPADDMVPAPAAARYGFMSPYPASVFQLLVAAGTLHLVDQGLLALDTPYRYVQAPGSTCLGAAFTDTRSTRSLLERMITTSDNESTCMLLKQLSDAGQLDAVNAWLAGLGLTTLQLTGIDAGSGGRWDLQHITMTALDTGRLLLLVDGAPGVLWHADPAPGAGAAGGAGTGAAVTSDSALSAGSRALLRGLLGDQGFNEVLSTANWCGRSYPAAGIPQRVPQRWIDPSSGTVIVDGIPYGQDVRPCNASAQVSFAHKTGLTYNFGADAGIVDPLPGARDRHYVVVVLSDVGYRYADSRYATSTALPCTVDVCYTEAFAKLGKAVDDAVGAPAGTLAQPSAPVGVPTPSAGPAAGTPQPAEPARRPGPGAAAIPA